MLKKRHKAPEFGEPISIIWLSRKGTTKTGQAELAPDGGLITTDYLESSFQDERRFVFHHVFALTSGNEKDFLIKTNSSSACAVIYGNLSGKSDIRIYDTPAVTDSGTEIAGYNSVFKDGVKSPETQVFHTPTISNVGTKKDVDSFVSEKEMNPGIHNRKIIGANRLVMARVHAYADIDANMKIYIYEFDN